MLLASTVDRVMALDLGIYYLGLVRWLSRERCLQVSHVVIKRCRIHSIGVW